MGRWRRQVIEIEVDFRSGVPIYIQIMDQIVHLIATGVIAPGDQLPPVRRMAEELRVNFNTVARAYRLLDEGGVISTQHGRGTFVLEADGSRERDDLARQALIRLALRYATEARKLHFGPAAIREALEQVLADPESD